MTNDLFQAEVCAT